MKGVSLEAKAGDVVSLIGSSGSGKSTLLRCINMLEVPNAGSVSIDGEQIALSPEGAHRRPTNPDQLRHIRSELGMVFQSFNLWSHKTILENVMEAPLRVQRRPSGRSTPRPWTCSKRSASPTAHAFPAQLSGGQQQRAAIARPVHQPQDHAVRRADLRARPQLEVEVLRVIKMLADEGRTMLLVTHDMKFARDVSDKVVFLHLGRIEEEGTSRRCSATPDPTACASF